MTWWCEDLQSATHHEEHSISVPVPDVLFTDCQGHISHVSSEDIDSSESKQCNRELEMEDLVRNVHDGMMACTE